MLCPFAVGGMGTVLSSGWGGSCTATECWGGSCTATPTEDRTVLPAVHGLGKSAGNHVEDHLSLPAASSIARREYPLPSIHPFRRRGDRPDFRLSENRTIPLATRAYQWPEAFAVCNEPQIHYFFLQKTKGYEKMKKLLEKKNKSPHRRN